MAADDPVTHLSSRLGAGDTMLMAWCTIPEPAIAEALVRAGFDAVLLDMQHGSFDIATASAGISAVAMAGKPALVRIPVGDFATASRMLDAGAAAIVAPMINNADDARSLASFTNFPPTGSRSWGPGRALTLTGLSPQRYLHESNGFQLTIAMIETSEALAALDDILAVPGIDGVLVGPSDLSIALSHGDTVDANSDAVTDALRHVTERCRHHAKVAALFCADGAKAKAMAAMGFQLCSAGTDQSILTGGSRAELGAAR
jgi:4-hydroxy-2-oxoheptanedioate aldolase